MSGSSVSLIDAVYSARLSVAGLPALANVQTAQTGSAPSADPYAAPTSTLTTLSGYGQLLSAASRAGDELQSLLGANSNLATSSAPSVATASADATAASGSYAVVVSSTAKANTITSAVFADDDTQYFSAGTIDIKVGSGDPVSVTIGESNGLIGGVNYQWGSLNSMAAAINNANAGVTASVESDAYGYKLSLTANSSGAANTISLSANTSDPFEGGGSILSALGFTQTQAASDASFTIEGIAGTSPSNTGIDLASGATFNIVGTGSATVTVSSTPSVAADASSVSAAATKLVQSYNALIGTASQLLASGGALDGDATTASPLTQALYDTTQTGQNGTDLTSIGITGAGGATGVLSLNTTTLAAADVSTSSSLLTSIVNTLYTTISGYLGNTGSILTQAKTTQEAMTFLNGQAASSYPNLAADIKQYALLKSLSSANVPTGLPELSVFT